MFTAKVSRPYFDAWLRRTGRQLAVSGRLTQVATLLSKEEGGAVDVWKTTLRQLLDGSGVPSLDLLTKIDALLSPSVRKRASPDGQGMLGLGI